MRLRPRRTGALILALALGLTACGDADSDTGAGPDGEGDPEALDVEVPDGPDITVASFNFPESTILAEIYAQAFEEAGYPVERQLNLGARELIFPELQSGSLSFLPEYLGSALVVGFEQDPPEDVDSGVASLEEAFDGDVTVFTPAPAANANAFVTTTEFAEENGLSSIADLADAGPFTFTGPPECEDRDTCLLGLTETYGLDQVSFSSIQEPSARLGALTGGEAELALFFSTDAILADDSLTVLEDTEQIVPPENITPVVASDVADAYGEDFAALVDAISELLDTETLVELNTRASEGVAPDAIAREWLEESGLLG